MHWYQIVGWVIAAYGALGAVPGVVKLVARPRSWRMPRSLDRNTFSGLLALLTGLGLATLNLWPWIAGIILLAARFLVWVNNVRVRRQKAP